MAAWATSALSLTHNQRMLSKVLSCATFACLGLLAWAWQGAMRGRVDWAAMHDAIGPMYACHGAGALFVCCDIPERQTRSVVLHSHVLMHVAVVCGMCALWWGYSEAASPLYV